MAGNEENISIPVLLGEGDYLQRMLGEVAQWRKQYLHCGRLKSFDGTPIQYYYAINPKPRGSMVMLHGFCEFIGKYRRCSILSSRPAIMFFSMNSGDMGAAVK